MSHSPPPYALLRCFCICNADATDEQQPQPPEGTPASSSSSSTVTGLPISFQPHGSMSPNQPYKVVLPNSYPVGVFTAAAELPDSSQLWRTQKPLMIAWFLCSSAALALFAPFFVTTGLFLGGEVAAILGILASSMHLFRSCNQGKSAVPQTCNNSRSYSKQPLLAAGCSAWDWSKHLQRALY